MDTWVTMRPGDILAVFPEDVHMVKVCPVRPIKRPGCPTRTRSGPDSFFSSKKEIFSNNPPEDLTSVYGYFIIDSIGISQ